MKLNGSFMIRTANSHVYQELVQNKKFFKRQIDLFVSALAIGIVNKKLSNISPNHDIIRLRALDRNLLKFRNLIDFITQIICIGIDENECGKQLLSYADGGLEIIWEEYQAQGVLDLPRYYQETTKKWIQRIPELIQAFSDQK